MNLSIGLQKDGFGEPFKSLKNNPLFVLKEELPFSLRKLPFLAFLFMSLLNKETQNSCKRILFQYTYLVKILNHERMGVIACSTVQLN